MDSSDVKTLAINDTKAGMEGLDIDRINSIVHNASKGSNFYEHRKIMQEKINDKIKKLTEKIKRITSDDLTEAVKMADSYCSVLEKRRNLNNTIVHIDMDAFYAAVEIRDNPALESLPMAVGSNTMLCTSNYIARKYGVRAAMPGFIAKKLCPNLVIIEPNMDKYIAISEEIHKILVEYDASFHSMSLDEAYLDISSYLIEKYGDLHDDEMAAKETVKNLRDKIYQKTNLTASAGIACNTLLAKICSDICKPNNQFYLKKDVQAVKEFIAKLPIRKVPGIGNVSEQLLQSIGIVTCKDLWDQRGYIYHVFSKSQYESFMEISLGIGCTCPSKWGDQARKSISVERTFIPTNNCHLMSICKSLAKELSEALLTRSLQGKTLTVKMKTHEFQTITRAKRLLSHTTKQEFIFNITWKIILQHLEKGLILRLVGLRMSNLISLQEMMNQPSIKTLFERLPMYRFHNTDWISKKRKLTAFSSPLLDLIPESSNTSESHANHVTNYLSNYFQSGNSNSLIENGSLNTLSKDGNKFEEQCWETPNSNGTVSDIHTHISIENSGPLQCPVCFVVFPPANLKTFNTHIDLCLNRSTLNELKVVKLRENTVNERKRKITDFFLMS